MLIKAAFDKNIMGLFFLFQVMVLSYACALIDVAVFIQQSKHLLACRAVYNRQWRGDIALSHE